MVVHPKIDENRFRRPLTISKSGPAQIFYSQQISSYKSISSGGPGEGRKGGPCQNLDSDARFIF